MYREGILPSGQPLRALRENQTRVEGATAACVNCHRRSGLGNVEGNYVVPPITEKYLMRSAADNNSDMSMPHVAGYHQGHVPYTDASLARALRDGVASADARAQRPHAALRARCRRNRRAGGLSAAIEHRSVSRCRRYDALFCHHHHAGRRPRGTRRDARGPGALLRHATRGYRRRDASVKSTHEIKYRVTRQWRLQVWELTGAPQTWEGQLHERMAAQPVFAVLSGLGRATWQPVHRFCESARALPVPISMYRMVRESDFYSAYFSRGVLLEADLMAQWLAVAAPRIVLQVYRQGEAGEAAARQLRTALGAAGTALEDRPLAPAAGAADLAAAVHAAAPGAALVLWLRPPDLAALPATPPPRTTIVFSGLMGGLEGAPLGAAWRGVRTHELSGGPAAAAPGAHELSLRLVSRAAHPGARRARPGRHLSGVRHHRRDAGPRAR